MCAFSMRAIFLVTLLLTLCACSSLPESERTKRLEIKNAYENWELGYRVRKCKGICGGSKTRMYYIDVKTSSCLGSIDIKESCTNDECKYSFSTEGTIWLCS